MDGAIKNNLELAQSIGFSGSGPMILAELRKLMRRSTSILNIIVCFWAFSRKYT
jgi:hypothetical protein